MAFSSSSSSYSTTPFFAPPPPPPPPLDLELIIVSAKHLKNVNWRNGDLKPYVVFHLDPAPPDHHNHHHHHQRRLLATSSDDSGSTRPVWNERFTLPLTRPVRDLVLSLEVYHSIPSETENPLVGSAKFPLSQLADEDTSSCVRTLELVRPSGRPQGKIRIKLATKERVLPFLRPPPPPPPPPPPSGALHNYQNASQFHDYYSTAPFPPHPYHYYPSPPQPPPMRPLYNPASLPKPSAPVDFSPSSSVSLNSNPPSNYGVTSGPSAPVDYSSPAYDCWPLPKSGGPAAAGGSGGGGVGLSGAMAGLNLEEVKSYEKEKLSERESNYGYGDYHYHHDY